MAKFNKPLVYPPVVLAHIIDDLKDYFEPKMIDKNQAHIHYSAQLNGHPHMGTLTSLATTFAIGEYIQKIFEKPAILKFEALDNAPIDKQKIGDKEYCRMHAHHERDGRPLSEIHMDSFSEVMQYFSEKTGVGYEVETYREFQQNSIVRQKLLEIISREEEFAPYISPSERRLRIRFPCEECNLMEKTSKDSTLVDASNHMDLLYVTSCPKHGEYEVRVSPQSTHLVDFNTSLRNVIKEAKFIEDARQDNAMNLMVDGGDWTGMAFQVMQSLGLMGYGIRDLPLRIFSPIIEDWSGAKFSKSVYVKEGTYKDVPEEFLNYVKFQETFGVKGLEITLDESREWIADPKKLFRNYSVEYLKGVYNL